MTQLLEIQPASAARRLLAIAAIHALAQWFADNPDVPMPEYIHTGTHRVDAETVRGVVKAHGGELQAAETSRWGNVRPDIPGLTMRHTMFTPELHPAASWSESDAA